MAHDVTKQVLGGTGSSAKVISSHASDPLSFPAGQAVSLNSSAGLSLLKSAGRRIGISLGRDLSNTKQTSVARTGESVPLVLELKKGSGNATITSYANLLTTTPDSITIGATVFTAQSTAVTPGDATFRAATNNNDTATSLAAQINAHATAGALVKAVAASAVVNLYAKAGGLAGNIALAYTDNGGGNIGATVSGATLTGGSDTYSDINYVTKGAKAYINDTNGKGDFSTTDSTISDATYVSGVLTGIAEDGVTTVPCALVDMPGGL